MASSCWKHAFGMQRLPDGSASRVVLEARLRRDALFLAIAHQCIIHNEFTA
jgi:hypothetical protein